MSATMVDVIEKAIRIVGGQTPMARLTGRSQGAVSKWVRGASVVPSDVCLKIEQATSGQVTVEELRPDLKEQWAYLRSTGCDCKGEAA